MKGRVLIIAAILLLIAIPSLFAQKIVLQQAGDDVVVKVLESNETRTVIEYNIGAYDKVPMDISGQTYYKILCGNENISAIAGEPALPRICRSIIIPDDAKMEISVLSSDYVDFKETQVVPSKGNLSREIDPETVPYVFGDTYQNKAWFPEMQARLRDPYILRDYRGTVVEIYPFQYNHSLKTLRVYKTLTVEIRNVGPGTVNVNTVDRENKGLIHDYDVLYRDHFINYTDNQTRYSMIDDAGDMLIITDDAFHNTMLPLVNWKMQKGINTTIADISTIGNEQNLIKAYIQDFYNTHDLAYVLLVGDYTQVTPYMSGGNPMDPIYAQVAGSDEYPDIFVGRFSAENATQVETQVDRTITYESTPVGSDWFHKGTGIASAYGSGGHNGGEYDYVHMGYIRDSLMSFYHYTEVDQIYDPGATASQVTGALNSGRGFVNYCGHGSVTSWSTTGFSNANVNALVNDNMLPFIFSVACVNGDFDGNTCFAEAWLRATDGGYPTGAIATYMSSINQSWAPPMDAQDEATHLIIRELSLSIGGICFNSACKMIDLNGSGGVSMSNTWHIFGDPSVLFRSDDPTPMTVNHDAMIPIGATEFSVTAVGVEGALCALYYDGVLFGHAYTNSSGAATIPIAGTLPEGQDISLTVTAYNRQTYTASISVSVSDTDGDGVYDDGDGSGIAGDNPCSCGEVVNCDDNCLYTPNPNQEDRNRNGVGDVCETIPCDGGQTWTAWYGGTGSDVANFVQPLYDTTWNITYEDHTVRAYSTTGPLSATIPYDQYISYELFAGSDYPLYAEVRLNGNLIDRLENPSGCSDPFDPDCRHYGSFYANEGDQVTVIVDDLALKDSDKSDGDRTVYTYAQFTYTESTTTIEDITLNGYAVAGSLDGENRDFHLIYTDDCGKELSSASLGTANSDFTENACLTSGNDIVVVGYTQSTVDKSVYAAKFHIDKVTQSIVPVWSHTYNYSSDDRGYDVIENSEGGYTILATTDNGSDTDLKLIKLSAGGSVIWTQDYGTATYERAGGLVQYSNGDYVIAGSTGGPYIYSWDVYLIRTNVNGAIIWTSTLGNSGMYEFGEAVTLNSANRIVVCGSTSENGESDMLLLQASGATGALTWRNSFGYDGHDDAYDVIVNGDNGYVLAGRTSPPAPSYSDAYFVMADPNGGLIWEAMLGEEDDECAFSVKSTNDGGFILGGFGKLSCSNDFYVTKFIADILQPPVIAGPPNGDWFYDCRPPTLDWDPVIGADTYEIQIDNNSDFSSPKTEVSGITATEFLATSLKQNTWYWRVRGENSSGGGFWSETGTFQIRYGKPTLESPANYAQRSSGPITLYWYKMEDVPSQYAVQVADNMAFENPIVDVSYVGTCYDIDCHYTTTSIPDGTYYWRVKSTETDFYWSNIWTFYAVTYDPSCPVLYSFDGSQFVQENPLLTACELSNYQDKVTDYYQLTKPIAPRDGEIVFQLREMEDEVTYLDEFELITVDHSDATMIGCTVDGEIFAYETSIAPLSVIDQNGTDWTETVAADDGNLFSSNGSGSLIITFPNTGESSSLSFSSAKKLPCIDIDNPPKANSNAGDIPNALIVEQLNDSGEWVRLSDIPFRTNPNASFVMDNDLLTSEAENITIRISWDGEFATDEIRQYIPSDEIPVVQKWPVSNHTLNAKNASAKAWPGFESGESLVLTRGESIELSFDVTGTLEEGKSREYIVRASGRYEPDYKVFTDLIPGRYQLYDNYPNPFNPTTTISYDLPKTTAVRLDIYNILGRHVQTLVDETQAAGHYDVTWEGKNGSGRTVSSGIYFYKLSTGDYTESKKMTLLK